MEGGGEAAVEGFFVIVPRGGGVEWERGMYLDAMG